MRENLSLSAEELSQVKEELTEILMIYENEYMAGWDPLTVIRCALHLAKELETEKALRSAIEGNLKAFSKSILKLARQKERLRESLQKILIMKWFGAKSKDVQTSMTAFMNEVRNEARAALEETQDENTKRADLDVQRVNKNAERLL